MISLEDRGDPLKIAVEIMSAPVGTLVIFAKARTWCKVGPDVWAPWSKRGVSGMGTSLIGRATDDGMSTGMAWAWEAGDLWEIF